MQQEEIDFKQTERTLNNPKAIASTVLMGISAVAIFLLLPLFVGAMADHFPISEKQLSVLASADLAGFFISSTAFVFFTRNIHWRWSSALLLTGITAINVISLQFLSHFNTFLVLRFVCGLGQGGLISIVSAHLSDTVNPERNYGLFFAGQTVFAAILLFLLPGLIASKESPMPILFSQSIMALISLCSVIFFLPKKGKYRAKISWRKRSSSMLPVLSILGILAFYITQGGTWAFIERIGHSFDLKSTFVGIALSISMAGSFIGSMTATFTSNRQGRKTPLLLTLFGQIACLIILFAMGKNPFIFAIAITGFAFFWAYCLPFILGIIIGVDQGGKAILFTNPLFALGVSIAPIILSFFIVEDNYIAVAYLSSITLIISMGLYWFLAKHLE